ncbi:MAG: hypothetical protein QG638_2258, partial [Pseudomonadota bacterium]|nr:hypothetical protein [Pseudomonadota bacterium]
MNNLPQKLSRSQALNSKLAGVVKQRVQGAQERFQNRLTDAFGTQVAGMLNSPQQ